MKGTTIFYFNLWEGCWEKETVVDGKVVERKIIHHPCGYDGTPSQTIGEGEVGILEGSLFKEESNGH